MTYTQQTTIWCEGTVGRTRFVPSGDHVKTRTEGSRCLEWDQYDVPSVRLARLAAAAEGWTRDGKRDLCPHCTADEHAAADVKP